MTPEARSKLLAEACARHVPLELHRPAESGVLVARARMVRVEDDRILLNALQTIGKSVRFEEGEDLIGYFVVNDQRYTFDTSIMQARCQVRLNERKLVDGLALALPEEIKPGQRRNHYRVSMAGAGGIAARIHDTDREAPEQVPIDARRFDDAIVDLSSGGLGLRIEGVLPDKFRSGELIFVSFEIPDEKDDLIFLCEIRHTRAILQGTASRIGVQFVNWPDAACRRRQADVIQRYSARLQRELLRRAS